MAIKIKDFKNVAVGTVAVTGLMIANKQYVDPIAIEALPKIGIATAGLGFFLTTLFDGINVLKEAKRDSDVVSESFPSEKFSDGTKLVLWGVGMPIVTGAASWFFDLINTPKGNPINTINATINNKTFLETLHVGSDIFIISGVALGFIGGASYIIKECKKIKDEQKQWKANKKKLKNN